MQRSSLRHGEYRYQKCLEDITGTSHKFQALTVSEATVWAADCHMAGREGRQSREGCMLRGWLTDGCPCVARSLAGGGVMVGGWVSQADRDSYVTKIQSMNDLKQAVINLESELLHER